MSGEIKNERELLLGALVERYRRERGWSQLRLAAETGSNQSRISRLERGLGPLPDDEMLAALADVLDIDERELLRAAGRPPGGKAWEEMILDELENSREERERDARAHAEQLAALVQMQETLLARVKSVGRDVRQIKRELESNGHAGGKRQ